MAKYYLRKNGTEKVISDLTASNLKEMAKAGRLTANDEIRKSGDATWHRASKIKGFFNDAQTQEKIAKKKPASKEVRREETPRATGGFRRFFVKSVASSLASFPKRLAFGCQRSSG